MPAKRVRTGCYVCRRPIPKGRKAGTCSDECRDKQRARQRTPEFLAGQRERQNRYFRENEKYRDRHRNYMRGYMRTYKKRRKPSATNNPSAAGNRRQHVGNE